MGLKKILGNFTFQGRGRKWFYGKIQISYKVSSFHLASTSDLTPIMSEVATAFRELLKALPFFPKMSLQIIHSGLSLKIRTTILVHPMQSPHPLSHSLWPHGLQHTRLPYPSLSLGACSNSCPLSQWCHPTISFSVVPFSCSPQSFPASGSFPMSWLFTSGVQSIGASASNEYLGLISFKID